MNNLNNSLVSTMSDNLTTRLDALQGKLPTVPSKSLELSRAATRRVNDLTGTVVSRLGDSVRAVGSTAATATKTVVGQGRSAIERSAKSVARGRRETFGQLGAQVRRTSDVVRDETSDLLTDATNVVSPESGPLAELSKSALYDRAQAIDLAGRSSMSKDELVSALRSA